MLRRARQVVDGAKALRKIHAAGGPAEVRLVRVERPEGLVLTSSDVVVHVKTRSGETVDFTPILPVPFFYAWAYRLARKLHVPLISDIDPEDLRVRLPIPDWAWPWGKEPGRT